MNNLHRELAPITESAWDQIEDEARRTFICNIAGRRCVDVIELNDPEVAAVGTGHLSVLPPGPNGVRIRQRTSAPLIELRATFTVSRAAVDDVERGSQDSDWQPVKDAAAALARTEDGAIFDGLADSRIVGITSSSSNTPIPLPTDPREIPDAVARAVSSLRLVGVNGPYSLLLAADIYTVHRCCRDQRPRLPDP